MQRTAEYDLIGWYRTENKHRRLMDGADTYCHACGVEARNRSLYSGRNWQLTFNLEGDFKHANRHLEISNIIVTHRGRWNGGIRSAQILDEQAKAITLKTVGGYFAAEMPQNALCYFKGEIIEELEEMARKYPKHQASVAYSSGRTAQKHKMLTDLTDNDPLILVPDLIETGYSFLPLFVSRGCQSHCPSCRISSASRYEASDEQVRVQVEFFKRFYHRSSKKHNGAFIAGEDVLGLRTERLIDILQMAEREFHLSREPKPIIDFTPWGYEDAQGFAYLFGSFRSLKQKSVQELRELKDAGVRWVNLGLESADEKVLELMFPKHTIGDIEAGLEKLDASGIGYSLNVVAGIGDMEEEHISKTRDFMRRRGITAKVYVSRFKDSSRTYASDIAQFWRSIKLLSKGAKEHSVAAYPMIFL